MMSLRGTQFLQRDKRQIAKVEVNILKEAWDEHNNNYWTLIGHNQDLGREMGVSHVSEKTLPEGKSITRI